MIALFGLAVRGFATRMALRILVQGLALVARAFLGIVKGLAHATGELARAVAAPNPMNAQVEIVGLTEFRRDVRRCDAILARQLDDGLKRAAELVADEARRRAPLGTRPIPPGRRPRKRMRDTITTFSRRDGAGVRVGARQVSPAWPSGYRYPRRFEYGDYRRPFLRPALEAKGDEAFREAEQVLDEIARVWSGRGRGVEIGFL